MRKENLEYLTPTESNEAQQKTMYKLPNGLVYMDDGAGFKSV